MASIIRKSALIALLSAVASVVIAAIAIPALGGEVGGTAIFLSIFCPIVIAGPASAYGAWQNLRLSEANAALSRAHAELAVAHAKLSEKASRDDMTGMLNRESFFAALDDTHGDARRGALLIIDADHFKRINDNYGHLVGDDALLKISAAIARAVRKSDVLGRIGGEEFGAFLGGASDIEAAIVAERIRREVELVCFRPKEDRILPLTVSIGGTSCAPEATVSDLMRAADKRLYEAKQSGRNLAIFEAEQQAA
ncbi:MAG: GGDEF domain-containing protein [Rhizobiaceae bacterium]